MFKKALLFLLLWSLAAWAESNTEALQAADAVLAKAASLDEFLAQPALIEEYYTALQKIYGNADEFKRESFDAIVKQLGQVKDHVPGLKTNLWKAPGNTTLTIKPATDISGRSVVAEKWQAYVDQKLIAPLEAELATLGDPAGRAAKVAAIVADTRQRIADFKTSLDTMPGGKKAQGAATGRFYKELRESAELKAATAYLFAARLKSPEIAARFATNDADIILNTIEDLRTSNGDLPSEIHRFIADRVPKKDELLADKTVFPEANRVTRWGVTVPVGTVAKDPIDAIPMHPMHAIFKGVKINECVGGGCGFLASLSPERWANSAYPGAQVYAVMQNGRYHGFMMTVPMAGPDGKTYLVLDKAAGILRNKAFTRDDAGAYRKTSLFYLFVDQLQANRANGVAGIAVTDSGSGDHEDVRGAMFASDYYKGGIELGAAGSFKHVDPAFMRALVGVSPAKGTVPNHYGGNGITDATNSDAKKFTLLVANPRQIAGERVPTMARDAKLELMENISTALRRNRRITPYSLSALYVLTNDSDAEIADLAKLTALEVAGRGLLQPESVTREELNDFARHFREPLRPASAFVENPSAKVRRKASAVDSQMRRDFRISCAEKFRNFLSGAREWLSNSDNQLMLFGGIAVAGLVALPIEGGIREFKDIHWLLGIEHHPRPKPIRTNDDDKPRRFSGRERF